MNNRCGLNGASPHIHVHVNKVQEQCRVCGRLLVAPRGKIKAVIPMHRVYTQYLALILTMMLSTFPHSNSVIDANKLWIDPLRFCLSVYFSISHKQCISFPSNGFFIV